MKVFENYANFYDTFYQDKDYKAECDFLEEVFKKYTKSPVKTILDLGCGTGGHSLILAQRSYEVTGVDFSEKMLEIGRNKVREEDIPVKFLQGDLRSLNLKKKFDAATAMFAVMGYQTSNEDVENTLRSVRRHLNPGGLFVFDVWFGPAVLTQRPTDRVKVIESGEERIIRVAQPVVDIINHVVQVNYKVMRISGDKILEEIKESHLMRFFFPQELTYFLQKNGFIVHKIAPFMSLNGEPTTNDWNISITVEAI
ncbi:MAG: class I SAM-dependent methyltransferase [bacterium]|nr:class I SAM-dependent methyltransferase [bacterium]